jgi:hypothetical protein
MRWLLSTVAAFTLCASLVGAAVAANLVVNGGFESNTGVGTALDDWSNVVLPGNSGSALNPAALAHTAFNSGIWAAAFQSGETSTNSGIQQTISGTSAGESYLLTFMLKHNNYFPNGETCYFPGSDPNDGAPWTCDADDWGPNGFYALWNGANVGSFPVFDQPGQPYTPYAFSLLAGGGDTITFGGYNGPGWWILDDVSIVPEPATLGASSVPEPATLGLLGLALVGATLYRRKRR